MIEFLEKFPHFEEGMHSPKDVLSNQVPSSPIKESVEAIWARQFIWMYVEEGGIDLFISHWENQLHSKVFWKPFVDIIAREGETRV